MTTQAALPSRLSRWCETAGEIVGSLIMLAIVCAIVYYCFSLFDTGLRYVGLTNNWMQSFGFWYVVGVACAFYWPWKYRGGMRGHWLKNLPHFFLLALSGPFALLLGIPM